MRDVACQRQLLVEEEDMRGLAQGHVEDVSKLLGIPLHEVLKIAYDV